MQVVMSCLPQRPAEGAGFHTPAGAFGWALWRFDGNRFRFLPRLKVALSN
jgi:hypothetical protein